MSSIRLLVAGDLYLDRDPGKVAWTDELRPLIDSAELALCNYEAPITDQANPARNREVALRTPAVCLESVADEWDYISLAQNHILDFGESGLHDTLDSCDRVGLDNSGIGVDEEAAWRPARLHSGGVDISVFSVACAFPPSYKASPTRPGLAGLKIRSSFALDELGMEHPGMQPRVATSCDPADLAKLQRHISDETADDRLVLLFVHWGVPGVPEVQDYQREVAEAAVEAGVSAILGTHAHTIQGVDVIRGVPVLYGMSHIIFDLPGILTRWDGFEAETFVATLVCGTREVQEVIFHPLLMHEQDGISALSADLEGRVLSKLRARSAGMATHLYPDNDGTSIRLRLPCEVTDGPRKGENGG